MDHLNELVVIGGQSYHLSRATYMFLLDNSALLAGLNLKDLESYLGIVYWWSVERSRSMYVEDCLVPTSYAALLESCRSNWTKEAYPLSRFMEIFFSRHPEWHFFKLGPQRRSSIILHNTAIQCNFAAIVARLHSVYMASEIYYS